MLLVLLNGHHPWLKFFDIFASNNGHLRAILNRDLKGGSRFNKNKLIIMYCELFNQTLWQINNTYLPLCKRWAPWSNTQLNICKHPSCCLFSQPKVNVLPQPSNNIKCKMHWGNNFLLHFAVFVVRATSNGVHVWECLHALWCISFCTF